VGFVEHVQQNTIKFFFVTFIKLAKPIWSTIFWKVPKKNDKLMQKPCKDKMTNPPIVLNKGVCQLHRGLCHLH
jgi:hypothetical protein